MQLVDDLCTHWCENVQKTQNCLDDCKKTFTRATEAGLGGCCASAKAGEYSPVLGKIALAAGIGVGAIFIGAFLLSRANYE